MKLPHCAAAIMWGCSPGSQGPWKAPSPFGAVRPACPLGSPPWPSPCSSPPPPPSRPRPPPEWPPRSPPAGPAPRTNSAPAGRRPSRPGAPKGEGVPCWRAPAVKPLGPNSVDRRVAPPPVEPPRDSRPSSPPPPRPPRGPSPRLRPRRGALFFSFSFSGPGVLAFRRGRGFGASSSTSSCCSSSSPSACKLAAVRARRTASRRAAVPRGGAS